MTKSPQSHQVKAKSEFWLSNLASNFESVLLALLFLSLPTQLGKHFWPNFSLVNGIRVDYLSPTLYITDILIGLLFLFWLTNVIARSETTRQSGSWFVILTGLPRFARNDIKKILALVLIAAFLAINIFSANRPPLSAYYVFKLIEFSFLGFYLAQTIRSQLQLTNIAILFAISGFFESLLSILQFFNQGSLSGWLYYLGERQFDGATPGIANASISGDLILRPYGTFSHPNVLAGYLLLSSLFILYFLVGKTKGALKYFGIFVLLVMTAALFLTLSRVVLLLWGIIVIGLFIRLLQRKISFRMKLATAFAALLVILFSVSSTSFSQLILHRFEQTTFSEESIVERTSLMENALQIAKDHLVSGVGLGNFIPALAPLQKPYSLSLYLQPVHNIYLLVLAETGIIGVGMFCLFLLLTCKRLLAQIKSNTLPRQSFVIFSLLFFCVLIIGLTDHYFLTLQQGQMLFAVILGFCWVKKLV